MIYIGLIIFAFLTWYFPTKVKLILVIINIFIPDPLPYVDEIIMIIGLLKGEE